MHIKQVGFGTSQIQKPICANTTTANESVPIVADLVAHFITIILSAIASYKLTRNVSKRCYLHFLIYLCQQLMLVPGLTETNM